MIRLGLLAAILTLFGLLVVQCSPGGSLARSTPDAVATGTPASKQGSSSTDPKAAGQRILSETIARFNEVQSYQFAVSATVKNTFEGQPREWSYKGSGAFAKPDKIQWTLEGQADVFMQVVGSGGKVFCKDTRGENTRDCSLAFGGPLPGSSPYTVIAYLKNAEQTGTPDEKSIEGTSYDHVTFAPSMPKISALDAGHSLALSRVTSVSGELWIDKKSRLPFREKVLVKSASPGDESVEMVIVFSKFNEQVEIKLPSAP